MDGAEWLLSIADGISGPAAQMTAAETRLALAHVRLASAQEKLDQAKALGAAKLEQQQANTSRSAALEQVALQKLAQEEAKTAAQAEKLALAKAKVAAAEQAMAIKAAAAQQRSVQSAEKHKVSLQSLASVAQSAGGPIGALTSQIQSFASVLGQAGAAGAVVAFVAVVVAGVAALAAYALAAADAARSSRLLSEAAAGSAAGGAELEMVIGDIASRVPLARAKIAEMGRSLELARFQGREMQLALQAITTTAAAVGDSAAGKIQAIAESSKEAKRFLLGARDIYGEFASLKGTGIKAADIYAALAESMQTSVGRAKQLLTTGAVSVRKGLEALDIATQKRFGGTVKAQMLSLSVQTQKLGESFKELFGGVKLDGFLKAIESITSLFDQNTVTGRVLKKIFGDTFTGLFDTLGQLAPYFQSFVEGLIIGTLLVQLGFYKLRNALRSVFGSDTTSKIDMLQVAMYLGAGAAILFAAAIGSVIVTLGLMAAPTLAVYYALYRLYAFFASIDWASLGSELVNGFVGGITRGIGRAVEAVKGLGKSAMQALKETLGIASPSKVFFEYGGYTAEGFAAGVEDGSGEAEAAVNAMGSARPGAGQRTRGGDIYNITINASGRDADTTAAKVKIALLEVLEGELHAGPEPEPA